MEYLLDASALLAYSLGEAGGERIEELLANKLAVITSVNLTEAIIVLRRKNPDFDIATIISMGGIRVLSYSWLETAILSSLKIPAKSGISLGDQICLAVASTAKLPILTADRAWSELSIPGITVELIR